MLAASVMARSVRAPSTHARTHLLSPTYTATTFDELIFGSEWYSNRNDERWDIGQIWFDYMFMIHMIIVQQTTRSIKCIMMMIMNL